MDKKSARKNEKSATQKEHPKLCTKNPDAPLHRKKSLSQIAGATLTMGAGQCQEK
jgi:hypothetical protein